MFRSVFYIERYKGRGNFRSPGHVITLYLDKMANKPRAPVIGVEKAS